MDWLRQKIDTASHNAHVVVDETLDEDIWSMASESSVIVNQQYPEGSFERVFWEQQQKAASLGDSRLMRWHPLFIKWCLYLCHLSGKAYDMLRDSKCIQLPSQRTLRDYTHYSSVTIGFSPDIDQQLRAMIDFTQEWNGYFSYTCMSCISVVK